MNNLKIIIDPEMLATPTEQYGMAGGSIDALIESRDPPCDKLDLRPRNCPVIGTKIRYLGAGQILRVYKAKEATLFIWNGGQRAPNVRRTGLVNIGLGTRCVFRRDPRNPRKPRLGAGWTSTAWFAGLWNWKIWSG